MVGGRKRARGRGANRKVAAPATASANSKRTNKTRSRRKGASMPKKYPPWVEKLLAEMPAESRMSCENLALTLSDPFNSTPQCLHADAMVPSTCLTGFGRYTVAVGAGFFTIVTLNISTANNTLSSNIAPVTVYTPATATTPLGTGTGYYYQQQAMINSILNFGGSARCLGAGVRVTGAFGINAGGVNLVSGLIPGDASDSTTLTGTTYNNLYALPQLRSVWCGSSQNFLAEVNWRPNSIGDMEFDSVFSGTSGANGGQHVTSLPIIIIQGGTTGNIVSIEFIEHFEVQTALGSSMITSVQPYQKPIASLASIWSAVSNMIMPYTPVISQIAGIASETALFLGSRSENLNRTINVPRLGYRGGGY